MPVITVIVMVMGGGEKPQARPGDRVSKPLFHSAIQPDSVTFYAGTSFSPRGEWQAVNPVRLSATSIWSFSCSGASLSGCPQPIPQSQPARTFLGLHPKFAEWVTRISRKIEQRLMDPLKNDDYLCFPVLPFGHQRNQRDVCEA